jgi:ADP-ribose pyrophosphatase YjhB (NUDIX family)
MNSEIKKGVDYTGVTTVFYCHDGKGNVVMQKRGPKCRDEQGKWDIGGGGLEFGAQVEENLKNEIKEEYCTDVLDFEFLGYRDVHRENNGIKTHWISLDFKVLVDRKKVKNGEPEKFEEVKWFPSNSLPTPLHSQLPIFLDKYKEKLQK